MTCPEPVCWPCWDLYQIGSWPPLRSDVVARCCFCAQPTRDGLTACVDPVLVPYPQEVAS